MMRRYLTEGEQQQLLRAAKTNTDPLAQRDYWWMRLLIELGARVNEFHLLTLAQAEAALATGWLVVSKGQRKGGKRGHEYAVTQTVRECLVALCFIARNEQSTPCGAPSPLVWGRDDAPLSVRSYQARLKVWVAAAGLDARISIHWLRHTRGMNIMRRSRGDNPLKLAQLALGHSSLSSTGVYLQMSREEYLRELQQIDGGRLSKRAARAMGQQPGAGA